MDDFEDPLRAAQLEEAEFSALYQPPPPCTFQHLLYDPSGEPLADPCPAEQRHGAGTKPWTRPQPNSDPCPNCILKPGLRGASGTLYLEIDEDFSGTLTSPTLTLCPDSPSHLQPQLHRDPGGRRRGAFHRS